MLVISNMYPSANDPVYGTFVRTFFEAMERRNNSGVNRLVAIKGKRDGMLAKAAAYMVFYAQVLWHLLFGRYDLVYVHTITFPIIPIRIARMFRRLPLVFNVHGGDVLVDSRLKKFLKRLAYPVLPDAKCVVVPSEYFKEVMISEFPHLEVDKLIVSPSGGIANSFYDSGFNVKVDKGQIGSRSLVFGYVSRIDVGKGWDIYLKAMAELINRGVDCKGLMAGRGEQVKEMLAMRSALGLEMTIDYLGAVAHKDLPGVYRRMDAFVFPTTRSAESLGLVGLEAMASGVPVIASRIGAPAGYVNDGTNGFLFEPGDVNGLADILQQFSRMDKNAIARLRENAYGTAGFYESESVNDELYERLVRLADN